MLETGICNALVCILTKQFWFIEAKWRIYAPINETIIYSDNGLSSVRNQAMIYTNVGLM